ncbi:SPOR domain-containing protein [Leptolyngbya sp. FACHB-671]|nr:SPOR domain-containing protein [Leptolyngbya sp. FACHB-671]
MIHKTLHRLLAIAALSCLPGPFTATVQAQTAESVCATSSSFNTTQQGNVIVLGRSPTSRYVVVVPARRDNTLNVVRQCVPDAFLADSRLGDYVQAGAFPNRSSAENLSRVLRSRGLDARVAYF